MVRAKAAALDVLHNEVEDLKNKLAGFKKVMAGVCRKYDDNFRRNGASARQLHEGWIGHEAAIEKINERCTCGTYGSSDSDADVFETVSSPSPIGDPVLPEPVPLQVIHWGQGVKYPAGTLRRHGVHRHKVITMCPPIKNRPHFE